MSGPIVLDLRYATAHYPGVGSYAAGLARALLTARPHWPWRVLVPRSSERFDLSFVPASAREAGNAPAAGPAQVALGARLRAAGASLYFAPYLLRPWGARCPCVVTVHDVIPLEHPHGMGPVRRIVYRELVRDALRADVVITDSNASREAIVARFPRTARAPQVVYPGCRVPDDGEPWPAWPRPALLVVGINKPHKNLETLVRALASIPEGGRPLLVSAGPADARWPDVHSLAMRHGVSRDVVVLGMVPEARLAGLYRSAALFAFPTRHEGFGLPLLEALSLGVPALASDLPVLREVGGDAARYVTADDPAAWAGAIRGLLADEAARTALARRGPERARRFDFAHAAEQLAGIFATLAPALAEVTPCP